MKPINKLFKEINFTFVNLTLFNSFLNALIVFLASYLIISALRLNSTYALIPSIVYFIIAVYTGIRIRHVREIEKKFPELDEELRTAADNINMENPVVHELQQEVLDKIKRVDVGSFFNTKKTSHKILLAIILCFGILFIGTFNMTFDFKIMVENIPNYVYVGGGDKGEGSKEQGDVRTAGTGTADEIFGEEEYAQLGEDIVDIEIKPSGYEIDLSNVETPRKRYFQELYPDEICVNDKSCRQSEPYGDELTKEQSEIVKNYFLKITS